MIIYQTKVSNRYKGINALCVECRFYTDVRCAILRLFRAAVSIWRAHRSLDDNAVIRLATGVSVHIERLGLLCQSMFVLIVCETDCGAIRLVVNLGDERWQSKFIRE